MAIIRRMDLDGDSRVSREEFIQGLMPEQPYSKTLIRQEHKAKSSSFGFSSFDAHQSPIRSPLDVGKHLLKNGNVGG